MGHARRKRGLKSASKRCTLTGRSPRRRARTAVRARACGRVVVTQHGTPYPAFGSRGIEQWTVDLLLCARPRSAPGPAVEYSPTLASRVHQGCTADERRLCTAGLGRFGQTSARTSAKQYDETYCKGRLYLTFYFINKKLFCQLSGTLAKKKLGAVTISERGASSWCDNSVFRER